MTPLDQYSCAQPALNQCLIIITGTIFSVPMHTDRTGPVFGIDPEALPPPGPGPTIYLTRDS
jgi:hypothetical protein